MIIKIILIITENVPRREGKIPFDQDTGCRRPEKKASGAACPLFFLIFESPASIINTIGIKPVLEAYGWRFGNSIG
jgi:hypothetical protein